MAREIDTLDKYRDALIDTKDKRFVELDSMGNIIRTNEEEISKYMDSHLKTLEAQLKTWDNLKHGIQSTYGELDRLSSKKYTLFNVKTWREDLDSIENNYKKFQKELKQEAEWFNKKWGKATSQQIRDNMSEWMADNNRLLAKQKKSLEMTKEAASKALDEFRKGSNIFDRFSKHVEAHFQGMKRGVNEFNTGFTQSLNAIKEWTKPWAEANQASADFAKNIGLGAAGMKTLLNETIRFAQESQIGINYNKSLKEMIKLQQDYVNSVGRNISLTDKQKESMAAMSAVMGDQKTIDITSKLENFGLNSEQVGNRIGKMFDSAAKKGIAFSKYSEVFANNIKLAQNYTFANGVRGVASMAEKAAKLKLEMQAVANFAEKVNTVEGAITTGAKLQVLGGSFTQFSDPLQMLYEGTSDMEGLQDRIINMFGNLGRFNKLKGEVEVSAFDRMRIKAAGDAIGVNSSELMEMIHAKGKRNEIANQLEGLGYSDDLKELIMNTATFDDKGRAGVSLNGKFVGVDQLGGKEEDLIALNQSESDDIKEIAKMLRGWDDTMQGFQKQREITQAAWVQASGLGTMAMSAVQYLGQANWALNTIVGLISAKHALNFGMGGYGMLQGGTRTVAGALSGARMNNWMSGMGLSGKDLKTSQRYLGKNMGVLYAPDGSFTRKGIRNMIGQGYAARGAGLGISNGSSYTFGNAHNAFIPHGNMAVAGGGFSAMGMTGGPVGGGFVGGGGPWMPSMSPYMGGMMPGMMGGSIKFADGKTLNLKNYSVDNNGNLINTKTGESIVSGKGGHVHHVDKKGKKTYIGQSRKDGSFAQGKNVKSVNIKNQSLGTPHQYGIDEQTGKLTNGIKGTLKDGTKFNTNDFKVNEKGQLANKSGQRLNVDKHGNLQLRDNKGRLIQNVGKYDASGNLNANKGLSNSKSISGAASGMGNSAFWGKLGNGAAMMGSMLMSAGLSMGASAVDSSRQQAIAEGRIKENSNEDWNRRTASKALSWAGTGASIGSMLGMYFGPWGMLIGAGVGALAGGLGGIISGKTEQKREQKKSNLLKKISLLRNGRQLNGEYDNNTLMRFLKYIETQDSSVLTLNDLKALEANGDYNTIIRKKSFSTGGPLTYNNQATPLKYGLQRGKSHYEGGIDLLNKNTEQQFSIQGGEYVLNKKTTTQINNNAPGFLDNLNNGSVSINKPSQTPSITPISPTVTNNSPLINRTEVDMKPLSMNFGGTVKVDFGRGGVFDLLNDRGKQYLSESIAPNVMKEIRRITDKGYRKDNSLIKNA